MEAVIETEAPVMGADRKHEPSAGELAFAAIVARLLGASSP
jgi:hypothetical protein